MTHYYKKLYHKKGKIFVVSAPSGSGKTTICNKLLKIYPDLIKSISYTTRKPRAIEKNGKDYYFINKKEFEKNKREDKLLEWTEVLGNYYATAKDFVEEALSQKKNILLSIDVKGAMQVKKIYPDAVLIFILPPSTMELRRRLSERKTESKEEVENRMKLAKDELRFIEKYEYIIVNDNLDNAVENLKAIIIAENCKIN